MEGPLCDSKCRKEKQLQGLTTALENTEKTKDSNPQAYAQARTNFYTLKEGPGWVTKEKQKVASQQVDPVIQKYQEKYNLLKQQLDSQRGPENSEPQEVGDEAETRFIMKQLGLERDEASVAQRLVELRADSTTSPIATPSWLPWILNISILVLGVLIVYFFISRKKYEYITKRFSGVSS